MNTYLFISGISSRPHIHVRNNFHLPRDNDITGSWVQYPPKRFLQHPGTKVTVSATEIRVERHRR